MKKGYFKTLAALAAGAMLLSMNMSAFALNYKASTTYKDDMTATVSVTDVIASAGDEVAFLAQNGETIIYVDQETADADGKVGDFSFDINLTDAAGTPTIKVGSTTTAAGDATSIKIGTKTITLKSDGNGFVGFADTEIKDYVGANDIADVSGNAYDGQTTITFYAAPAAGYKVSTYTLDSGEEKELVVNTDGAYAVIVDGTQDHTISVTFVEDTSATTVQPTYTKAEVGTDGKSLTVFGKAKTGDCGIKVANSTAATTLGSWKAGTSSFDSSTYYKFPALVKLPDGSFVVTLTSETANTFGNDMCVAVYDGDNATDLTKIVADTQGEE